MNYSVIWRPDAIDSLAPIWMSSPDRSAITDASEEIDRMLSQDPSDAGESRPDGQRVGFALPLGIRFEIVPEDRLVNIVAVWLVRKS